MNKKDGIFLGLMAALLAAILAPALFSPGRILGNFGDVYTYHYPLRHLVTSLLQQGHLPFWNPYIFCGGPLAANSQAVRDGHNLVLDALAAGKQVVTANKHLLSRHWDAVFGAARRRGARGATSGAGAATGDTG